MTKLAGFVGATVGGWLGWWLGAKVGIMTAFMVSMVGAGLGIYLAVRFCEAIRVIARAERERVSSRGAS